MQWSLLVVVGVAFGALGFAQGAQEQAQQPAAVVHTSCGPVAVEDAEAVGRKRRVVPLPAPVAPRCDTCPDGTKICCPDCSLWVNKSCVCDCKTKSCSCQ